MNLIEKNKEFNVYKSGSRVCVVRKFSRPMVDEPFCHIAKDSLRGSFRDNAKLTKNFSTPLTAAKAFFRECEKKRIKII